MSLFLEQDSAPKLIKTENCKLGQEIVILQHLATHHQLRDTV